MVSFLVNCGIIKNMVIKGVCVCFSGFFRGKGKFSQEEKRLKDYLFDYLAKKDNSKYGISIARVVSSEGLRFMSFSEEK